MVASDEGAALQYFTQIDVPQARQLMFNTSNEEYLHMTMLL